MEKVGVGIIGCGNISGIYFSNCKKFKNLELLACADLIRERAEEKAKEFQVPKACSVEELLSDERIQIAVNLTIPKVHVEVNLKAIEAGKNVYVEKPLGLSRDQAKKMLEKAGKKKLLVGCAPDTFMGGGIQTCRKIIDDGTIGEIVGASAFMMCRGHETWHPDPEFYYEKGGGPMFDMGPYYLTALINLIGPVRRVSGMTRISFPERIITSKKKYGKKVKVEVPTHVTGIMDFEKGGIGMIITSFDVSGHRMPCIDIYGSKGTLTVPDPNCYGGVPELQLYGKESWDKIPLTHGFSENSRGLGVSDMAHALTSKTAFRPTGELAFHVLDIMQSFHESSDSGKYINIKSRCDRPEPMPAIAPDWMNKGGK